MKWLIRAFFKTLRAIIGPIMLLGDWITTPRGVERSDTAQEQVDAITANMTLYQFKTCPFCIKVRRSIKRQSLNIEHLDAQHNNEHREQLMQGGGQIKVPCLKVIDDEGNANWLYESNDIISYLRATAA
ncbi:MAG: glutaredoxin [Sulfuriflexus sp.]|nr:glutaredoxin [Sulfuriflexus sp.]